MTCEMQLPHTNQDLQKMSPKESHQQDISGLVGEVTRYKAWKENADAESAALAIIGSAFLVVVTALTTFSGLQPEEWPDIARLIHSWILLSCALMALFLSFVEARAGRNAHYYYTVLEANVAVERLPELKSGSFHDRWVKLWDGIFALQIWLAGHITLYTLAAFLLGATKGANVRLDWTVFGIFAVSFVSWIAVLLHGVGNFQTKKLPTTAGLGKKSN